MMILSGIQPGRKLIGYFVMAIAVKDVASGHFDFAPGDDYIVRAGDILVTLGKHEDIDKIKL